MSSDEKTGTEVAARCLCLELLHQRWLLEIEEEESLEERERGRALWLAFDEKLGIAEEIDAEERALLEAPVGSLDPEAQDDLHGRATGALVLLWALSRLPQRPAFASVETMAELLDEHGLLGDGAVAEAKGRAASAELRPAQERDDARAAYMRLRGKAREVTDPDRIFAEVGAHHLAWTLDAEMAFDDDIDWD